MKKTLLSLLVIVSFAIYALLTSKNTNDTGVVNTPVVGNLSPEKRKSTVVHKDGEYVGISSDAYYGYVQVKIQIQNGRLTDVIFLSYPNHHGRSIIINNYAMPYLKQEAIAAQSANVDIVTGATDTSRAFIESLSSALLKSQS